MSDNLTITEKIITDKIYIIRNQKVMLDRDLATLYGVETRVLNQAVKRNIGRSPDDFMFEVSKVEFDNLISQIVTSSWGGTRKTSLCLHRTRCNDALKCSQERQSHSN